MSVLAVVPFPLVALAIVIAAVALIVLIGQGPMMRSKIFRDPTKPLATLAERKKALLRLETDYPRLEDDDGKPVNLLFAEAKAAYDAGRDRIKQLDAKAVTLVGIVTTGFGAIAFLGDPSKTPKNGMWLGLGLIALGIAFALALLSLVPRTSRFPSLSFYVLPRTVEDPSNEPRIKLELTESWLKAGRDDERSAFAKARFLGAATAALGIGLVALTVNYTIGSGGEKPLPTIRVIIAPDPSPNP